MCRFYYQRFDFTMLAGRTSSQENLLELENNILPQFLIRKPYVLLHVLCYFLPLPPNRAIGYYVYIYIQRANGVVRENVGASFQMHAGGAKKFSF